MSRRDGSIYVGRLSKSTRTRDIEEIFEPYGRLLRCDIKYGTEMAYAFIDFEDRRDAEDCVKYENGRELNGQSIVVEWAKGGKEKRMTRRSDSSSQSYDECFRCRRTGHWARDCPDLRWGGRRGGGGGGGGGRWRSPSPRRRSRSRSRDRKRRSRSKSRDRRKRSRSRDRRRSRSKSGDRKRSRSGSRKSRSASDDRKKDRRSRSGSRDKKKNGSASKSRSPSKSPRRSKSDSKSRSRSKSPVQQLENHDRAQANGDSPKVDGQDDREDDYGDDDDRRSRSGSKD